MIKDVFRPDDPLTVPLLRLMIATDDVRHLQKLLMMAQVDETSTDSDRLIHNGEVGHLFRLLCGHLYEAATPFRAVDRAVPGRLDEAVADDVDGKAALAAVRAAYELGRAEGLRYSFLYLIRNKIAFHYGDEDLRRAFERHVREGHLDNTLVLAEASGFSRFTLTDSLLTFAIADALVEDLAEFQGCFMQHIGEAITLTGQLDMVVGHLLGYLVTTRKDATSMRADRVTIPQGLRTARDQVEQDRKLTLSQHAERLRDAIMKSKLCHPEPWDYTTKARNWADRAQKIVDEIARDGETEAHRRVFFILKTEVDGDEDFQTAQRLF